MKTNSNIAFFVKLSNSIGLGHFIRLVDLQKKLNPKHAIWIIAGKNKIIYSYLKKKYIYKTINFQSLNILKILKSNNITKIIMDLSSKEYLIKNKIYQIQKFYKSKNFKVISFDIPIRKKKIISHLSIIPYDISSKIKKDKRSELIVGTNLLLNGKKNYYKKKLLNKKIKRILICISGTDPKNIAYKVYKHIKHLQFSFDVIVGNNFEKIKIDKKNINKKDRIYRNIKNITKKIAEVDAVICGEGLIKYESVFQKKPTILIHQYDTGSPMIKNFLKTKTCLSLGLYRKLNSKRILIKIKDYLNNINLINKNIENMNKYFDYNENNIRNRLMIKKIIRI